MLSTGTIKKERRNPNDPARFIGKVAATEDGETAKIHNYLDTEKIEQEALYDGLLCVYRLEEKMVLFQNQFSLYGNISRFPICRYFRNADF